MTNCILESFHIYIYFKVETFGLKMNFKSVGLRNYRMELLLIAEN